MDVKRVLWWVLSWIYYEKNAISTEEEQTVLRNYVSIIRVIFLCDVYPHILSLITITSLIMIINGNLFMVSLIVFPDRCHHVNRGRACVLLLNTVLIVLWLLVVLKIAVAVRNVCDIAHGRKGGWAISDVDTIGRRCKWWLLGCALPTIFHGLPAPFVFGHFGHAPLRFLLLFVVMLFDELTHVFTQVTTNENYTKGVCVWDEENKIWKITNQEDFSIILY